jgi:8-oxo-dGTP pyrophosphatase MutT (NUDIX family)
VAIWNNHKIGMKRMSAGGMIFDPSGKTLLIKSRLRGTWEWPAGRSEGNESPLQTCRREVCEESGLDIADFRFLGVNFQTGGMTKNGRLNFTFVAEVSAEARQMIAPRLKTRFYNLLSAYEQERSIYMEAGEIL